MSIDYHVKLIQFPTSKVKESVVKNEDDSYTIFIESSLSFSEQQKVFRHAMEHIIRNDFEKEDVDNIEYYTHHCIELSTELSQVL